MGNDLRHLMREYFENRDQIDDRDVCLVDVLPMSDKRHDVAPVKVQQATWNIVESPNRLMKTFTFDDYVGFKAFVDELLIYQEEIGHHAKITLQDGKEVIVEVYTHDVDDVTEIDHDYAGMADAIYEDAKILEMGTEERNEYEEIGY